MLAHSFVIARRTLILVFATISMFGCITTSAMAHTTGQLAEAMSVESHRHAEDAGTLHEMAHAGGMADLSHDSPCATATVVTPSANMSSAWIKGDFSMGEFGLACMMERPPRA